MLHSKKINCQMAPLHGITQESLITFSQESGSKEVGGNGRKQETYSCFPPYYLPHVLGSSAGKAGLWNYFGVEQVLSQWLYSFLIQTMSSNIFQLSANFGGFELVVVPLGSLQQREIISPVKKYKSRQQNTYSYQGPQNSLSFAISTISNNSQQCGLSFCGVEQYNGSCDNGCIHNIPGVRGLRLLSTKGPRVQWSMKPASQLLLCSVTMVRSCHQ